MRRKTTGGAATRPESDDYAAGKRHGESWARTQATASEIGSVDAARQAIQANAPLSRTWCTGDYENGQLFVFMIKAHTGCRIEVARQFWEAAVPAEDRHRINKRDFLIGFADGALQIKPRDSAGA